MDEILDSREQECVYKVEKYVSEVKAAMKDETAETAGKMFNSAMVILNQDLPDPACQERERQTRHYESDISEEMKVLKDKPDASEKHMRESQKEAQKYCSSVELQHSKRNNVLRLTGKLEGLKNQVQSLDPEIIENLIDLSENDNAVEGLRTLLASLRQKNQLSKNCNAVKSLYKLQALSRQKNQAAAAATPPLTAPIASALSRLLKDFRFTQRRNDYLDWMCEKFCASIRAYVSAVKAELRLHTGENAAQIFERAIDFLSQDPTSIDGQSKEEEGGDGNELNSLKNRISQVEKQLQEAQNERLTLESVLESIKQEATNVKLTLESVLESFRQEAQKDRQEAQKDRQEAQNDRQEAQKDRREAQNDRQEAQNERLTIKSELESLKKETQNDRQEAQNERLTIKSELGSLKKETQNDRQEAQNERLTIKSELGSLKKETQNDRQEAQNERLTIKSELGSLKKEAQNVRQEAQNERLTIKSELGSLKKETQNVRQEAQNERLTIKSELGSLKKETQNDRYEAQNERLTIKSELGSLKKEVQNVRQEAQSERLASKSQLDSVRREAQNNRSSLQSLESSMTKNAQSLDAKLETLATETKPTEVSKENSANIQELRRELEEHKEHHHYYWHWHYCGKCGCYNYGCCRHCDHRH
ncbi:actin cytoskeleton-regulatory complex protein pan1 [Plakobranchus ocellatus]|uniref:Actin cytoskeleton-regulatory complex protein pan1 n=1 Tax=Plakobranchus ocellatus TaxID=259542 RepID=A0AAV4BLX8_9GAST|nr:actin cytoskeleton-regulatory complex protein pan1 [Plakobranchus ocellatus]